MRNSIQYFENPPIYRPAPSLVFKTWVQSLGREDLLEKGQAIHSSILGFPGGSAGKESACYMGALGSIPGLGRYPWRRDRLPTPVFWPGEFHGLYSPWGCKELDTTQRLLVSPPLNFKGKMIIVVPLRNFL